MSDFKADDSHSLGRFKLVSRCFNEKDRTSAEILHAVNGLKSNDQQQALKGLIHMLKLAQLGKPFNQLVDSTTAHEAFEPFYCEITKRNETVWRYRHGDIRILFYYAANKVVLLAHILPKRRDRLSAKDMNQARQSVFEFLNASQLETGIKWI